MSTQSRFASAAAHARGLVRDAQGQVALTFALTAVPCLLLVGSAIDYSRAVSGRSDLQQATDAAVLAVSHDVTPTSTAASLRTQTVTFLQGVLPSASLSTETLSNNNTQLCIATTGSVPTTIMNIINIKTMAIGASACAGVGGSTYEIALALDNSGSMTESAGGVTKIASLVTAASALVTTMIPSSATNPTTSMSIVPFNALVNVGPANKTAAFMDTQGQSSIHWQNFQRPPGATWTPASKFDLFNAMTNTSWAGCVEQRPVPYTTTDTAANSSAPDTLFVPFFSPDEPGPLNSTQSPYTASQGGNTYYNSYIADDGYNDSNGVGLCTTNTSNANWAYSTADKADSLSQGSGLSMVCKYKGSAAALTRTAIQSGLTAGPNLLCTTQPLTPLTNQASTLTTALSSMVAGGDTDLLAGFMWAWRTISPVANPFPVASPATVGPQNPKPYTGTAMPNTKVIILMTDGMNNWVSNPRSNYGSIYEGFGYFADGRLSSFGSPTCNGATTSNTWRCQMDAATVQACTAAKAAGITIYSVGFSISGDPIDAAGLALLSACASDQTKYFVAADATSIVQVFAQIGQSITNLRLTQ